jgi:hypothetical protein
MGALLTGEGKGPPDFAKCLHGARLANPCDHRLAKQHEAADNLVRGGLSVRFRVVVYAWPNCETISHGWPPQLKMSGRAFFNIFKGVDGART